MSNDGVTRNHILGGEWRAVDGAVWGGVEGGADAVAAEAMCAGSACHRLYEGHTANNEVNIRELLSCTLYSPTYAAEEI